MVSLEFFIDLMAMGATQPPTEMSTRNISWGVKAAGAYGWQPYHLQVSIVLKSGNLNLLEHSGPVQACNGIALHLFLTRREWKIKALVCWYIPDKAVNVGLKFVVNTIIFNLSTLKTNIH